MTPFVWAFCLDPPFRVRPTQTSGNSHIQGPEEDWPGMGVRGWRIAGKEMALHPFLSFGKGDPHSRKLLSIRRQIKGEQGPFTS